MIRRVQRGAIVRACGVVAWLGLGAAACGDDLPDDPPSGGMSSSSGLTGTLTLDPSSTSTGDAPTSSEGSTSTSGPSTVGIPDECTQSDHCLDGEVCVAPFDQTAGPEGKGAYACVSECVAIMDEDRWCADAAACCDPTAECTDRGYCVAADGGSTGGSESSTGRDDGGSTGGSTTG
jgi:hypothetical protein